jgi:uncharacterized tellurite resistance protein B-like protein
MEPSKLSDSQKQALMDLLVLGMYADHNLSSAEDACAQRLLDAFQFSSDYERQSFCDAAFTRASRYTNSPESIRAYVTQLAANFSNAKLRREVYDQLDDLLTSDGRITSEESQLLTVVKEVFQLE